MASSWWCDHPSIWEVVDIYLSLLWKFIFHLTPQSSVFLAVADFQKLQEAKEVLCNETKRKNYDLWKRSAVVISFHDWQALNDSVKTVCGGFNYALVFQNTLLISGTQKAPKHSCSCVCSQCTGPWEIRRNQCWKPQKQKSLAHPKQRIQTLSTKHRGSLLLMPCRPQVSTYQNVLRLMKQYRDSIYLNVHHFWSADTTSENWEQKKGYDIKMANQGIGIHYGIASVVRL